MQVTKPQVKAAAILAAMPLIVLFSIIAATYTALRPYFFQVRIAVGIELTEAKDYIKILYNQVRNR